MIAFVGKRILSALLMQVSPRHGHAYAAQGGGGERSP
jgi:hypothetical protein